MVDKNQHDLLKIGLTEGETKVYLALIKLGSSTVGPIVKEAKVAYSNVYDILQRLIGKGLVSYIVKNKTKYFQASSPSGLQDYLDKKEREILAQKQELKRILPNLKKLQEIKPQQDAEIFLGTKGLKTAYEKLLDEPGELIFFYIHEKEYAKKSDLFYFSVRNLVNKKKIKGLSNEFGRKSKVVKEMKFINYKFVDFPIPGNIDICNDKLLLISWQGPIIAILIHSQSLANNFRKYFYSVWDVAKK